MERLKWPGINETTAEPRGPALTRLKPQVPGKYCAFRVVQGTQRPRTSLEEREKERKKEERRKERKKEEESRGGSVGGREKENRRCEGRRKIVMANRRNDNLP